MKAEKFKKYRLFRRIVQIAFLLISCCLTILLICGKFESAHAFCPYSQICFGFMSLMKGTPFLLFPVSTITGIIIVISTMFTGRIFCSYVCPFGTVQELLRGLNKRNRNNQVLSQKLHNSLKYLKYLILLATLFFIYFSIQFIYHKFCPVLIIAHPQSVVLLPAIFIFVIFCISFFIERFWCRYLCPYAALMNIFEFVGRLLHIKKRKVYREISSSMGCKNCLNYCPMQIEIEAIEIIDNVECIHCLRCVRTCCKEDKSKKNCLYNC